MQRIQRREMGESKIQAINVRKTLRAIHNKLKEVKCDADEEYFGGLEKTLRAKRGIVKEKY